MFGAETAGPAGRRHVGATILIAGTVLATVIAAVSGAIPGGAVPSASPAVIAVIPHLNVILSLLAIGAITFGWHAIRRGRVRTHRRLMSVATALFGLFLTLYLYRLVILGGPRPFPGPGIVYRYVYLPVLAVHIVLALCCVPLLVYVLTLAVTIEVDQLGRTPHPTIGRIAAPLWLCSFALGIVVYALLYWPW